MSYVLRDRYVNDYIDVNSEGFLWTYSLMRAKRFESKEEAISFLEENGIQALAVKLVKKKSNHTFVIKSYFGTCVGYIGEKHNWVWDQVIAMRFASKQDAKDYCDENSLHNAEVVKLVKKKRDNNQQKIKLVESGIEKYQGVFTYLVMYDHTAGRKSRYNVYVLNADHPVVIGRELPMNSVLELIGEFEKEAGRLPFYTGSFEEVNYVQLKIKMAI